MDVDSPHDGTELVASVDRMVSKPSDTRERLIAAAIALIEDRGVSRLRLREVAEAVGIQEPSIYAFFRSRDDLIVEASVTRYQRGLLDLSAVFVSLLADATTVDDFRTAVRTIVGTTFGEKRIPFRAARMGVLELARTRPRLAARILIAQQEADEQLGAALRSAAERGWARADVDPATLARWVIALINGRVFLELDPERRGAEDWDRLTMEAVLRMLDAPDTNG